MSALAAPATRMIPGAIGGLLGGVLLCAILARVTDYAALPPSPPVVARVALTFADRPDGGIAVHNAASGALVASIPARDDGFLRMTLRLLAAARLRQNIGQAQPFELTEFSGGRMRLSDPATGLAVELEAFGPSNVGEFTRLFTPETHS